MQRLKKSPEPFQTLMNRRRPEDAVAAALEPGPDLDRHHWERVAEETLSRAFATASAGLSLPGLDGRGPEPPPSGDASPDHAPLAADAPQGRLGFRLSMGGSGSSFTPLIGACFHFESLRRLTAASGRQLGLKGVIVVRGQVVLLPDAPSQTHQHQTALAPWPSTQQDWQSSRGDAFPRAATTPRRSLLGQAELVPQPLDTDLTPRVIGPAPRPLWGA